MNIGALLDGATSHIPHGAELLEMAESMVLGDNARVAAAREALFEAAGAQATVDAIGVAANFERMTRIADATGIPLGETLEQASADVREELALDRFKKR